MFNAISEQYRVKRPGGTYDPRILCNSCDEKLGIYDEYAKAFLSRRDYIYTDGCPGFVFLDNADVNKISIFIASYIWRASLTTFKEFSSVNLGIRHTENLRKIFVADRPTLDCSDYEVILAKYSLDGLTKPVERQVLLPTMSRAFSHGINCYEGLLPGLYKFWLKVDQRKFPDHLNIFYSPNSTQAKVWDKGNFIDSKDFAILKKLINQ